MVEVIHTNKEQESFNKSTALKTHLVSENSNEEVNIELLIRTRYSMSQELALHRKKIMGIVDESEWNEYCSYIQECIEKVRNPKIEL